MDIVGFVKNATNNLSPERYNTALQQTVKIIVKLISDSITMKRVIEHKKYIATLNDYFREVICVCPKCDGRPELLQIQNMPYHEGHTM